MKGRLARYHCVRARDGGEIITGIGGQSEASVFPGVYASPPAALVFAPTVDARVALGDEDASANLNKASSSPNLVAMYLKSAWSADNRTFNVPPWRNPVYTAFSSYDFVTMTCPVTSTSQKSYIGTVQAATFDGLTNMPWALRDHTFTVADGLTYTIMLRCKWTNLGTSETIASLYKASDTTTRLDIRKLANNTISILPVQAGTPRTADVSGYDFDSGGINTYGYIMLTVLVGAVNTTYLTRSFFNGTDSQSAGTAIVNANFPSGLDSLMLGANAAAGNRATGGIECVSVFAANLGSSGWTAQKAGTDPATLTPRVNRALRLPFRSGTGYRDLVSGEIYTSSAGTPTLAAATGPSPLTALYLGTVIELDYSASATTIYGPESEGLWLIHATGAADKLAFKFGTAPTAVLTDQFVTSYPALIYGSCDGSEVSIISDASGKVWLAPLLGDIVYP